MAVDLDRPPSRRNCYERLVSNQKYAIVDSFTFECGQQLRSVPVAYKTWGELNEKGDNVLVLCHALTGSSDAEDWWEPLMGHGRTFDHGRFFLFCANQLGSPYGTASPLTTNPQTGSAFGPDFPETTIRDDVRIQKHVLDALGVTSIAAVIGGSMGGMLTLEWPLCTPDGYVNTIIAIATSSFQTAWGISWNEAQRQAVMADANFKGGWYDAVPSGQPVQGLGAARMVAMLTYRSAESFESRFHRKPARMLRQMRPSQRDKVSLPTPSPSDSGLESPSDEELSNTDGKTQTQKGVQLQTRNTSIPQYAAQSYMQYQADKFLARFDANCYISLSHKMDSHDVTRGRVPLKEDGIGSGPTVNDLKLALSRVPSKSLVISVKSDVLFRNEHQVQLAECLPDAQFVNLDSRDGHDGFLLEFEALALLIEHQLRERIPWAYEEGSAALSMDERSGGVITSIFGEAEPEF